MLSLPGPRVPTSVEHKSVHPNLLIASNADFLYQFFLVAYSSQCGHEPAIAIIALSDIVCGCAFYEELWSIEDVL